MTLPTKSLQFTQNASGDWSVEGMPGTPTLAIEETRPVRDWLAELDIPKDWAKIEAMAQPRGLSARHLRFIVADESPTLLPGAIRLQPKQYLFHHNGQMLTMAHLGFAIGILDRVWLAEPGEVASCEVEGSAILGEATLYDSALADAAWRGIQQGIFGHACGVVKFMRLTRPSGFVWKKDLLMEVAITDLPGCLNAKILKGWLDEAEVPVRNTHE